MSTETEHIKDRLWINASIGYPYLVQNCPKHQKRICTCNEIAFKNGIKRSEYIAQKRQDLYASKKYYEDQIDHLRKNRLIKEDATSPMVTTPEKLDHTMWTFRPFEERKKYEVRDCCHVENLFYVCSNCSKERYLNSLTNEEKEQFKEKTEQEFKEWKQKNNAEIQNVINQYEKQCQQIDIMLENENEWFRDFPNDNKSLEDPYRN